MAYRNTNRETPRFLKAEKTDGTEREENSASPGKEGQVNKWCLERIAFYVDV